MAHHLKRLPGIGFILIIGVLAATSFPSCVTPGGSGSSAGNGGARSSKGDASGPAAPPEIVLQLAHEGFVRGTVLTPDGRFAVSVRESIKIWDVESGFLVRDIPVERESNSYSLDISADGAALAMGHTDGSITIRSFPSCEVLKTLKGHQDTVNSLRMTADGRSLISGSSDGTAILWDLNRGEAVMRFDVGSRVSSVDIYPRGNRVITGSNDSGTAVWDAGSGDRLFLTGKPESLGQAVGFSDDGRYFFTSSIPEGTSVYDTIDYELVRTFPMPDRTNNNGGARFVPGGREIVLDAVVGDRWVYGIWNAESGTLVEELISGPIGERNFSDDYYTSFQTASFDPSGSRLIAGNPSGEVRLFDIPSGSLVREFGEPSPAISSIAASPDGRSFLTASFGGNGNDRMILWDRDTGRALWEQRLDYSGYAGMIHDVEFLPDGETFLVAYGSKVERRRVADGGEIGILRWKNPNPDDLDVSADGTRLVISCNRTGTTSSPGERWIELWDLESDEMIRKFEGHESTIYQSGLSPDGRLIVSASRDGTARLWDAATGREIRRHETRGWGRAAGWSPDGRDYYFGDQEGTHVVDAASGTIRFVADSWYMNFNRTRFTPDSRYLVTKARNELCVWDADSGNLVSSGGWTASRNFDITPDGGFLVSGNASESISFIGLPNSELIYTSIIGEGTETLTWIPEFYFSGSERLAKERVCVVQDMNAYTIDQFFESFYRPDVVRAKIEGRDISSMTEERNLADIIAPTPLLAIAAREASGRTVPLDEEGGSVDTADGRITLVVTAEDRGGGIDEIRLFHNGSRVGGNPRGLGKVGGGEAFEFDVKLVDGENLFRAVGFTATRVESEPALAVLDYDDPGQAKPVLRVLAVGINEYENDRYDLNYAVNDARSFVDAVERAGGRLYDRIDATLLTDSDATGPGIRSALDAVVSRSEPQDVFLFFYAGHGIALESDATERTEFYFIPTDVTQMTSLGQVESLGISGPEFEDLVGSIPARKQFLVLDACNSGAINEAFLARGAAEEIALSRLNRATGSTLIAASREDQFAQEFAELGQGALTKALLNGLAGEAALGNGQITVGSLKSYVESELPALTELYLGKAQYPMGFVFGQDFPIGLR